MRPSTSILTLALMATPALASAQSAPVCLESPRAPDAAYSVTPIAASGCVMPARYDVSIVDGCVGVYGADELTVEGDRVLVSGPAWGATIDVSGPDLIITPACDSATPVALAPIAPLETSTVEARAALLDDPRPDVRAAALEATARDQGAPTACAAISAFVLDAPSYGFAREAQARRALELSGEGCRGVAPPVTRATPNDPPPPPAPLIEDPSRPDEVSHAERVDMASPDEVFVAEQSDNSDTAPDGPGGMGYSFNAGWLVGDSSLGADPALSLWGGLKLFPSDDQWGGFFAPGIQFTLANTRLEVVPTLRVGMAYVLTTEFEGGPDSLARTFTAVEIYGILGIKPPIGNDDIGVRAGFGIASPIGLLVSLAAIGELELPLPNGIEFHIDHDLLSRDQVMRMNLTVGF